MSTLNVTLPPGLNDWLQSHADEIGCNKTELVRNILLAYYHSKSTKALPKAVKRPDGGSARISRMYLT